MELNIGANIKRLRLAKGLTQEQLAKLLNVSAAAISKWEAKNIYPDITMLYPLAEIFNVSIDELLDYDQLKIKSDIDNLISEYQKFNVSGNFTEASNLITEARKRYPQDYRIMSVYMWDKAGGTTVNNTEKLLNNQKEFTQICDCILDGCLQEDLRIDAIRMKAKLLYLGGNKEDAIESLSHLPDWFIPFAKEQLFDKDAPDFHYWIKRNFYGLVNVMAIKQARIIRFDNTLSISEKTEKIEAVAETYSQMSQNESFEIFCIGEQAVLAFLADMLTLNNGSAEDVIRIREKQFISIEKLMKLAESDAILSECLKRTYKINNMIQWAVNRLLSLPQPQFVKLRENSEYMEMLYKWQRRE